ncbi:hypothetical protein [Mycobacterium sp. 852014-52144_SCH5372336]|uniref:hypothetical protein n=1 Tax=Mycobacterium sp. 852014-52144_SCH5372336 TaxID=1834115 RepID=UPI000802218B|nr:hypothetical protein A5759_19940 [Mycobacterium sp. 852014-52144_SCH5372336]
MGENGFGSLGSMRGAFSVGVAGGGGAVVVVVVVVVVVDVSGAFSSCEAQPAVNAPVASTAVTPAPASARRSKPL